MFAHVLEAREARTLSLGMSTVRPTAFFHNETDDDVSYAGAPSLVNSGGHVGAADLLSAQRGEVFEADLAMPLPQLAVHVEGLLADQGRLAACGAAAAESARSWTETANAATLAELVGDSLTRSKKTLVKQDPQRGQDISTYCSLEHAIME